MLFKFFSAIKTQLVAEVAALMGVEWFNNQYEATILKAPVCFVEFPEAQELLYESKDGKRTTVVARLHVVSKVLSKVDAAIPDSEVQAHETIALAVRDALSGLQPTQTVVVTPATEEEPEVTRTDVIGTNLQWSRWQHFHKFQGYMVTTIDFVFQTRHFDA
jgi:hypothetical protein